MEMVTIILLVLVVILLFSRIKWRITVLNLIYYMEKNRYKLPDKEELRECTKFVVGHIIKDLVGH